MGHRLVLTLGSSECENKECALGKKGLWGLQPFVIKKIVAAKQASPMTSNREVARVVGISHPSVQKVLDRALALELDSPRLEAMSDSEISEAFYPKPPGHPAHAAKVDPDFSALVKELGTSKKYGLTRYLLWCEYQGEVGPDAAYGYSSFCEKLARFDESKELSMVLHHAPGEVAMADYAGPKIPIYHRSTGEVDFEASIFVMALGFSSYVFAEAHSSQEIRNCIEGHARAFSFYGGVPRGTIIDNLRAAVTRNTRDETILTRSYLEMCEHYGVIPAPARPYRPRDKSRAEGAVYLVETQILARLRKLKFFSLAELNEAIAPLLALANQKKFQKLPGSRQERYLEVEKAALGSLTMGPYEYASWQPVKVGSNYHFSHQGVYYSVPSHLRGSKIMIRISSDLVMAYSDNIHVATHRRSEEMGYFSTDNSHMPESHRNYLRDTTEEVTSRAKAIGVSCEAVIAAALISHRFPQSAHKSARAILRLAGTYSEGELEAACAIAVEISSPTRASVTSILAKGIYKRGPRVVEEVLVPTADHANIRGEEFYNEAVSK